MAVPQKPLSIFLLALGAFLVIDSLLALLFGSRYMLWGLERTPAFYQALIVRLSHSSPLVLLGLKLAEGLLGAVMLLLSKRPA